MDLVTQGLFGATVAQAGFSHRLGRRAIAGGFLLGVLPDLDLVAGLFGQLAYWRHHRGITHALLVAPLAGLLFGWLLMRWRTGHAARGDESPSAATRRAWLLLPVVVLTTHPLIDLFTSYGTQLLLPLDDHRFALDALPIIDVFYSGALIAALLVGALSRGRPGLRVGAAWCAIAFIALWTLYGLKLEDRAKRSAESQLVAEGVRYGALHAYPTLFQPFYRRVVAYTPEGALVGGWSSRAPGRIEFARVVSAEGPLVDKLADTRAARVFSWFAMERVRYVIERHEGEQVVLVEDLRYGLPGLPGSLWGVRARFDERGAMLGEPETFEGRRSPPPGYFRRFLSAAFLGAPPLEEQDSAARRDARVPQAGTGESGERVDEGRAGG